ncbi:MAG: dethiobiotin synthase [Omnitrophica bacterium]|nr:dethiobiotin synthase [Candidatus Omnitrophota bacterium]
MTGIFITGTDTGVGKSVVCGLLGRYLKERGYGVITQKWIQTGSLKFSSDIRLHLRLMNTGTKEIKSYLPYISPYTFKFSASPHLAAGLEKKRIKPARIKRAFRFLSRRFNLVLVEGAGGVLVPFAKDKLIIDIASSLKLPALVVCSNKLGAINHTLLTVEALRARKIPLIGIIFNNQASGTNKIILDDNMRIIKAFSRETVLGSLPWQKNKDKLYQGFIPIGNKILKFLMGQ